MRTYVEVFETSDRNWLWVESRTNGDPHTDSGGYKEIKKSLENVKKSILKRGGTLEEDAQWKSGESYPSGWSSPRRRKIGEYSY